MDPRGTVGRIYKQDHYTLLHTKYESSGPCGFREDFLCFSHCKSMGANDPGSGAIFDPRGMICRIYVMLYITILHTKYRSFAPCGFREEDFFHVFPIISLWQMAPRGGACMNPRGMVGRIYKGITINCCIQVMKALGLVVSEKRIFFMLSHCKSMEAICCHGNQSSDPTRPKT